MQEYLNSGLLLGEIYRAHQPVEVVNLPAILDGETVLPGFTKIARESESPVNL